MAEAKPSVDKKHSRSPILESLGCLFFVSKVLGLIPYSLANYVTHRQFKLSQLGNILCVLSCAFHIVQYHILMSTSMLTMDPDNSMSTLTTVIGIFIIYLEPTMMAIDVVASLINQKCLVVIFDRLREIDDKLGKENVLLNYRIIGKYSIIFLSIALVGEVTLGIFNLIAFQENFFSLSSLWWFISCIPLFANSVSKTWFLVLILLVQQRLRAINDYLNDVKRVFIARKTRHVVTIDNASNLKKDNLFIENIGYLEKEIFSTRNMKIKNGNAWNWVDKSGMTGRVNDIFAPNPRGIISVAPYDARRKGEERDLHQIEFD